MIDVVGMVGGEVFGQSARAALASADIVVASPRHLDAIPDPGHQERVPLCGALGALIDQIDHRRTAGQSICVVSSGDPGFFGITRLLAQRFGAEGVAVHPAPSSVSLAFAAAALTWDDAVVVSVHGREMEPGISTAAAARKAAILTSPTNTPQCVGARLIELGCEPRHVIVASRLGEHDERIVHTDLAGLAAGEFDPMAVVILTTADVPGVRPNATWGRDESAFTHRNGMITKSETRAVVLAKLALPTTGVMWDVGAGSGSVGIEAALLAPRLRVIAVERNADDAANISANAHRLGARVDVVVGDAPPVLHSLPDPDRVFVGGGGVDVMRACWERIRTGGRMVATSVVLEHALAARHLLGDMIQLHVDRCVPIGASGVRLVPLNPVFVCWGQR